MDVHIEGLIDGLRAEQAGLFFGGEISNWENSLETTHFH